MLQIKHLQALICQVGYMIFHSVAISDEDDDLELLFLWRVVRGTFLFANSDHKLTKLMPTTATLLWTPSKWLQVKKTPGRTSYGITIEWLVSYEFYEEVEPYGKFFFSLSLLEFPWFSYAPSKWWSILRFPVFSQSIWFKMWWHSIPTIILLSSF